MRVIETGYLSAEQKAILFKLWNSEYPHKLSYKTLADFDNYLDNLSQLNHYLLVGEEGEIEGWAFTFTRENEKWFAILLDSKAQGQGKGSWLLNKLKEKEQRLSGWVIDHNNDIKEDGTTYQSPVKFYEKNEFTILHGERLENDQLSAVKITWEQTC